MSGITKAELEKFFPITSVNRKDILRYGILNRAELALLTDEDMRRIAAQMEDDWSSSFEESLRSAVLVVLERKREARQALLPPVPNDELAADDDFMQGYHNGSAYWRVYPDLTPLQRADLACREADRKLPIVSITGNRRVRFINGWHSGYSEMVAEAAERITP